jgi:hypothetical protein
VSQESVNLSARTSLYGPLICQGPGQEALSSPEPDPVRAEYLNPVIILDLEGVILAFDPGRERMRPISRRARPNSGLARRSLWECPPEGIRSCGSLHRGSRVPIKWSPAEFVMLPLQIRLRCWSVISGGSGRVAGTTRNAGLLVVLSDSIHLGARRA